MTFFLERRVSYESSEVARPQGSRRVRRNSYAQNAEAQIPREQLVHPPQTRLLIKERHWRYMFTQGEGAGTSCHRSWIVIVMRRKAYKVGRYRM